MNSAQHIQASNQQAAPAMPMADWTQVAHNWWYQVAGDYEVHLSGEYASGWIIDVSPGGERMANPTYKQDFGDALDFAEQQVTFCLAEPVLH